MRQPTHSCVCQQALRAAADCDRSAALVQAGSTQTICTMLAVVQISPYSPYSIALLYIVATGIFTELLVHNISMTLELQC